jgi:hypothetical protein
MTPSTDDRSGGRWLDAQLHLLDRQVLDVDGVPTAVVDDLELSEVPFGQEIPIDTRPPVVTALLSGAAIATRIFGGRPPESRMQRTPWGHVVEVGVVIKLGVMRDTLDLAWTERWVRNHIIGRIPGGRHIPGRKQNNHSKDNKRGGS